MEKLIYKDKEYSDCIYTKQDIKLPFRFKLKILFRDLLLVDIKIYTEKEVGEAKSEINLHTFKKDKKK